MKSKMNAFEMASWFARNDVSCELVYDNEMIKYRPNSGFYKSDGCVEFYDSEVTDGEVTVRCRYGETHNIINLSEFIDISYKWYMYSKDRFEGWAQPPIEWSRIYEKVGVK